MKRMSILVAFLIWGLKAYNSAHRVPLYRGTSIKLPEVKVKAYKSRKQREIALTAKHLGISVKDLKKIFWIECRHNFRAQNPYTKAYGCIQFLPRTLHHRFGLTTREFKLLEDHEQLPYVRKYFRAYEPKSLLKAYLYIFFPLAVNKPKSWVLRARGISAYRVARLNKPFDLDGNGEVTVGEIETYLNRIR